MENRELILINSLASGGAERVALKIAESLNLPIVTIWPDCFYDNRRVTTKSLLKKRGLLFIDLILAFFKLLSHIKNNNISTVNSHLFWCHYLNLFVSFITHHKVAATHCVSFSSKYSRFSISYFLHFTLCRILLRKVDINIFKSRAMKYEYELIFKLKKSTVVYNPLDKETVTYLSNSDVNFCFKDGVIYLLSVGRFHSTKKQKLLIEAVSRINKMNFGECIFEAIFLGEGSCLDDSKEFALELGISDKCHFLGNVPNPYPFYKNCSYYISFSSSEGFPNALIEAIALKCYPIHADCRTGPREILTHFKEHKIRESDLNWYEECDFGTLFKLNSIPSFIAALKNSIDISHKLEFVDALLVDLDPDKIANDYKSVFIKLSN